MHCNLLTTSRSIALNDAHEGLAVFLPDIFLICPEVDVLLNSVCESERAFNLRGTSEETLLLIFDQSIKYLLKFSLVAICIEGEARKRNYGLPEKTGLKPGETGIDALPSVHDALVQVCVAHQQVMVGIHILPFLEVVGEFPLEPFLAHFIDRCREHHGISRLHLCCE